jgi:hypothetical protein
VEALEPRWVLSTFAWTANPTAPPSITSIGAQSSAEHDTISLSVVATDPNSYALSYSAVNLPGGLTINGSSGVISGTVDYSAAEYLSGTYPVTVIVANDHGGSATRSFNWTIADTPRAPSMTNPGPQSSSAGGSVSMGLTASSPDGDPFVFDAAGLPPGLSIDPDTGVITGTIDPTAASNTAYAVTVTVTDYTPATAQTHSEAFTWTVGPPDADFSMPTPFGRVNAAGDTVDWRLDVTTAAGYPLTWTAAGLPDGLSIDPNSGDITGTIANSAVGGSPHSVTLHVSNGQFGDYVTFTWTVGGVRLENPGDQSGLDSATVSLAITGHDAGSNSIAYSASGLPSGLSINSTTGVISGTIGSTAHTGSPYTVTITGNDGTDTTSQTFQWDIARIALPNPGDQTDYEGLSASLGMVAVDHVGTINWSAAGLPSGLTINGADGEISGMVSSSAHLQSPYHVTVTANDGSASVTTSFVWSITPQIALVNPGTHGNATSDTVSLALSAYDAAAGTPTFSASGLPTGLSINSSTGVISGTISGSSSLVTVTASDGTYSSSQKFQWNVASINCAAVVDQSNFDSDTVSLSLAATYHGGGSVTYSASGLPAGLSINASTGLVTGTLSSTGDASSPYTVTETATDGTATTPMTFNWAVTPRVSVDGFADQTNVTGDSVTLAVSATENTSDSVTWTYSANGLPTGLSLNSSTGVISGTISASPSSTSDTVTVGASDGTGSASQTFTWSIVPVMLSSPGNHVSLGSSSVNLALLADVASGYSDSFSVTGLPSGLSINSSTGVISGTLSGGDTGSSYVVQVTATSSGVTSTQEFAWRVGHVVVTAPTDQTNTESDTISLGVTAGATSGSLTYSAIGLPTGLSINSGTGVITGTVGAGAAANGPYSVIVVASNGSYADSQSFTWTVNPLVVVDSIDDRSNQEGGSVSFSVTASEPGATLSYSATGLPTGLSINSSTGLISGTVSAGASAHGPFEVDVTVSDGTYRTDALFVWTITHGSNHAPTLTNPHTQVNVTGDTVHLALSASDLDSDTLSFSATGLPDGLGIDSSTGSISGTVSTSAVQTTPYSVSVIVDDANGGSDTQTFSWIVNDSALSVTAQTFTATEGADTGDVTVATFTDTDPDWQASDFVATITWGDGTSDSGTIDGADGSFTVTGSHVYAHPGTYAPQISVTNYVSTVTDTGYATVSAAGLTISGGVVEGTVAGTSVSGTWASFTDSNPNDDASSYTAVINWGDGSSTTTGTVTGSGGKFVVSGAHTYASVGTDTVTVTLRDVDGTSDSATSTAEVGHVFAGVDGTLTVTSFTISDSTVTAGNLTATIDWGDGSSSVGTVSGGSGAFTVIGHHTYSADTLDQTNGTDTVTVMLTGPGSETFSDTTEVKVVRPPITGNIDEVFSAVSVGFTNAKVAMFTEPDVTDGTGEFSAIINWGDGSATTTGTVSESSGIFQVLGNHTYTTAGTFPITVTVSQAWGYSATGLVLTTLGLASAQQSPRPQEGPWHGAMKEDLYQFLVRTNQYEKYVQGVLAGRPQMELYLEATGQSDKIGASKQGEAVILRPIGQLYKGEKIPAPPLPLKDNKLPPLAEATTPPRTKNVIVLTNDSIPWQGQLGLAPLELMDPEKVKKQGLDFIVADSRGKDTFLYDVSETALANLGKKLMELKQAEKLDQMKSGDLVKLLQDSGVSAVKSEGKSLVTNDMLALLQKNKMIPNQSPRNIVEAGPESVRILDLKGVQISPDIKIRDITNLNPKENVSLFGGKISYPVQLSGKNTTINFEPYLRYDYRKDDPRHNYFDAGFQVIILFGSRK